ncbi:Alpha/Beta hydrolase protein [Obelidium mucronatum]|nr:Alpha/Beta hydrolase protein [Obelidium mucronatum]
MQMTLNETHVSFTSADGFVLHGTYTSPSSTTDNKAPLVVIVQGTGKTDRDGNSAGPPKPIQLNLYSGIAHFLASIGVASIRYDKRGTNASANPPPSYTGHKDVFNSMGIDDLAADAAAALNFGSTQPEVDTAKLYFAGHSEGGILTGRICKKTAELYPSLSLKGCMIICAFGETLETASDHQFEHSLEDLSHGSFVMRYIAKPLLTHVDALTPAGAKAYALDPANKNKDIGTYMFKPFPLRWYRDHFTLNLAEECKHIKCPVLIVGGGKDIQCDAANCSRENADRLLVNSPKVDIVVAPKMTHILRNMDLEHLNILKILEIYQEQGKLPLAPEFTEAVQQFLQ